MFTVFTLIPWEPDKETEHNMTSYKELLGTWRRIFKKQHIYKVFTKSFSKNSPN